MPRPPDVKFSDHLKNWRHERNLSQTELANLLGVSKITISNWESGSHDPRDIDVVELRLRELQTKKGETERISKDQVRMLWK